MPAFKVAPASSKYLIRRFVVYIAAAEKEFLNNFMRHSLQSVLKGSSHEF